MTILPGIVGSGGGGGGGSFIFPPLGAYSGVTALSPSLIGLDSIDVPLGSYSGITALLPELAAQVAGSIVAPLGAYSGVTVFEPTVFDPSVAQILPPLGAYSGITALAPTLEGIGLIDAPLGAYSGVAPLSPTVVAQANGSIVAPLGAYSGITELSPTIAAQAAGSIVAPLGAYSGVTALLPTVSAQSSGVVLLDAWTQESTGIATPGSKTISAGTDRVLLVRTLSSAGPAVTFTAISYGGQPMTLEREVLTTSGPDLQVAIWSLDEAGIAAAVGDAFTLTPATGTLQFRLQAASYENVDQTTPILDNFGAANEAGGNPTTEALTTAADGIAIATLGANRGTSDVGATEDASYSNMTELLEDAATGSYSSIATANTDGTDFTPGTTIIQQTAAALIGFTLQPPITSGSIIAPLGAYSGITALAPTLTGQGTITAPLGSYSGITALAPTIAAQANGSIVAPLGAYSGITALLPTVAAPSSFAPSDIANLVGDFDAEGGTQITEDANGVTQWDDLSTRAYSLAQNIPTRQPGFSQTTGSNPGGKDGTTHDDNSGDHVDGNLSPVINSTEITVAVAVTPEDLLTGSNDRIFDFRDGSSNALFIERDLDDISLHVNDNNLELVFSDTLVLNTTRWFIARIRLDTSGVTDFLSDLDETASGNVTALPGNFDNLSIGGVNNGGNTWTGFIHQVIIYERFITDTERDDLAAYLNEKWLDIV